MINRGQCSTPPDSRLVHAQNAISNRTAYFSNHLKTVPGIRNSASKNGWSIATSVLTLGDTISLLDSVGWRIKLPEVTSISVATRIISHTNPKVASQPCNPSHCKDKWLKRFIVTGNIKHRILSYTRSMRQVVFNFLQSYKLHHAPTRYPKLLSTKRTKAYCPICLAFSGMIRKTRSLVSQEPRRLEHRHSVTQSEDSQTLWGE